MGSKNKQWTGRTVRWKGGDGKTKEQKVFSQKELRRLQAAISRQGTQPEIRRV